MRYTFQMLLVLLLGASSLVARDAIETLPTGTRTITSAKEAEALSHQKFETLIVEAPTNEVLKSVPGTCSFRRLRLVDMSGDLSKGISSIAGSQTTIEIMCWGDGTLTRLTLYAILSVDSLQHLSIGGFDTVESLPPRIKCQSFQSLQSLELLLCQNPGESFWLGLVTEGQLKSLVVNNCTDFQDLDAQVFPRLKQLESLEVWSCLDLHGSVVNELARCPSLKALRIQIPWGLTGQQVQRLGACKSLTSLELHNHEIFSWADLVRIPQLESLSLGSCDRMTSSGVEDIGRWSNLWKLDLDGAPVSKRLLDNLGRLEKLKELHLAGSTHLEAECFEVLAECAQLEILELYESGAGGRFKWISDLENLKELSLRLEEGFTDDDLKAITLCENLESLELTQVAEIDPASYAKLGALPKLKKLKLMNQWVADDSLPWLTESETLTHLDLTGALVTNDFIKLLLEARTLEEVDLSCCNYLTQDAVTHLKAQRPGLAVKDRFEWDDR